MVAKRIIPCLDIDNNRTVKGVNFKNLVDAGDPIELARIYSEKGADELVFLDITATKDKRKTLSSLAEKISENINIPFTVGGGIRNIDDVTSLLLSGAPLNSNDVTSSIFLIPPPTVNGIFIFSEIFSAEKISENINIPFTVGGGIRNIDDVTSLLLSGAPLNSNDVTSSIFLIPPPTVKGIFIFSEIFSASEDKVFLLSLVAVISKKTSSSAPFSE